MIGISKNINAGSLEELLSNQIFNYYLSNISNDASFSPTQGVLNGNSPFTTTCEFDTTGCYDNSAGSWVDFVPDKDLNATVSLNTNLTLFWCIKPSLNNKLQGLIHTQGTTPNDAGLFIYYDTVGDFHIDADWGNGDGIFKTLVLDSDERQSPYCFTAIINSTGRSVELYFNNTFKANYSAIATSIKGMGTNLLIGRQNNFGDRFFVGEFELMSFYNITLNQTLRNFIWNNGNPFVITTNTAPTIAMNFPKNNNATHNKTIVFNFTINDPDDDKINYTLWADTNLIPDTNINQTLNVTEGTFIFNYTFGTEISGSINGTYYWKVNGTDNNSNNFTSSIFIFNITNNISSYNVTNVSITPLPLQPNTEAKCHFNITNKAGQEDIISISDQRWWLNNTLVAEAGNKTLKAGNVTLNANITCEARINNGYGETAWTQYVNSSQSTVGDTIAPSLTANYTEPTSAVENSLFDIFANVTDISSIIGSVTAEVKLPAGTKTNLSMSLDAGVNQAGQITRWKYNDYVAGEVGTYNLKFHINDGSSNNFVTNDNENLTFIATSAPSGGGGTTGGGGGGGLQTVIIEKNETIITGQCNFNKKCEPQFGEDSFNCNVNAGGDCEFKFGEIFPTCLIDKNQQCVWRTAIVGRILLIAVIISFLILISDTQQGRKVRKVLKERLNINLLKE